MHKIFEIVRVKNLNILNKKNNEFMRPVCNVVVCVLSVFRQQNWSRDENSGCANVWQTRWITGE